MLNISKGNMYKFVTHTWNPIKGKCWHNCNYCYMSKLLPNAKEPRLDWEEFNENLGERNKIFIGSSTDIFAKDIPSEWITKVMDYCYQANSKGQNNIFLLQSKNPKRFLEFIEHPIIKRCIFCTTLETNRYYPEIMRNAPKIEERVEAMEEISRLEFPALITAEPLMQFDHDEFLSLIKRCKPRWVNIGRNTARDVKLPEPKREEVKKLIADLEMFTKVHQKSNAMTWNS